MYLYESFIHSINNNNNYYYCFTTYFIKIQVAQHFITMCQRDAASCGQKQKKIRLKLAAIAKNLNTFFFRRIALSIRFN